MLFWIESFFPTIHPFSLLRDVLEKLEKRAMDDAKRALAFDGPIGVKDKEDVTIFSWPNDHIERLKAREDLLG